MKLLTFGNPKTAKGEKFGFWTAVLHLAPADLSGFNVCPAATAGCRASCLNTAGRGGISAGVGMLTYEAVKAGARNHIQRARIARTQWLFSDRVGFIAALCAEITAFVLRAYQAGYKPAIRLNGTSDIRWESEAFGAIPQRFPTVIFYDYTKLLNRKVYPVNYRLTYSYNERDRDAGIRAALDAGMNVAIVFRTREAVGGYIETGFWPADEDGREYEVPVIDGDDHDLRFLDPVGVIVGLYAKGNAKRDTSGFVID
jgi:hypothetical protein